MRLYRNFFRTSFVHGVRFLYLFVSIFLLISIFISKNVDAATNNNGCNNGDRVTVRYGKAGDNTYRGEFTLDVGVKGGKTDDGFAIAVRCEGDLYTFETITDNEYSLSNAATSINKDQISENGGDAGEYITWVGASNAWGFWISKIEQREETTNPDTGVADDAYNPTESVDENNANGKTEEIDADVDLSEGTDDGICYDSSGSLGWIICPIVTGISGVGEWLWGEVETNFLQIPVGQLFKNGSGIEEAWKIFRDIANTIFIILFLFVIFSQLTGIGIDNYGIKKIMPKLIVTAILINLSYVICVLAVDLSNILGAGLNGLFSSFAERIPIDVKGVSGDQVLALAGISTGGAVIFGLISGPLGLVSAGLWVLGIIFSIVISMLFLFLILLIRSAGIVILIAIAPIAIVCYMLPNTEKLFKRWLDLFKALIFVYPICGAMVGAGKLAGNLLASTGTEAMAVAGMIVQVLPFFLIPMLLRQSLSLAGNIGARLSATGRNLGRQASSASTGAIRNSERFKDWSNFQQTQRNARRAMSLQARLERRRARDGGLNERDSERLLKATETVNAYQQRRAQGSVGAYKLDEETAERRAEASLNAQEQKAALDEFSGMDNTTFTNEIARVTNPGSSWYHTGDRNAETRMSALIQSMEARGMESQVYDLLRNNDVSGSTSVMQTLAGSRNYMMQAYGKKGIGKSFSEFETDGTLQKYISDNGIQSADKDSLAEINANAQTSTSNGATSDTVSNEMAMSGALSSQTPKVREQMNALISNQIDEMTDVSQLANFKLNSESFGAMHDDTALTMLNATKRLMQRTSNMPLSDADADMYARNVLRSTFNRQITGARNDSRVASRVSHAPNGVGEIFGI